MKKVTEINLRVGDAIRKWLQRKGMTAKGACCTGWFHAALDFFIYQGNASAPLDILSLICRILEINMNQILQIPDFNFPGRMLHDPMELEFWKIFDQVPEERQDDLYKADEKYTQLSSGIGSKIATVT